MGIKYGKNTVKPRGQETVIARRREEEQTEEYDGSEIRRTLVNV